MSQFCCTAFGKARARGSDSEGYQELIAPEGLAEGKPLIMGCDLPPIRFCPWCGTPKNKGVDLSYKVRYPYADDSGDDWASAP